MDLGPHGALPSSAGFALVYLPVNAPNALFPRRAVRYSSVYRFNGPKGPGIMALGPLGTLPTRQALTDLVMTGSIGQLVRIAAWQKKDVLGTVSDPTVTTVL